MFSKSLWVFLLIKSTLRETRGPNVSKNVLSVFNLLLWNLCSN